MTNIKVKWVRVMKQFILIAVLMISSVSATSNDICNCKGYAGVGGPCYAGVGGPCYAGVGGPCYSGIGGTGAECPKVCK